MPKYLLPCACGNQIPVEPTDAGLTVACSCGAMVKVPNTRGIFALPQLSGSDPDAETESSARWGLRYQLLTAGMVCLLFGAIATGYLVYSKPENPVEWMAEYEVQRMPVNRLISLWGEYQDGFQPLDTQKVHDYQIERDDNARLTWVAYGVIAGGAALVVFGFLVGDRRRS